MRTSNAGMSPSSTELGKTLAVDARFGLHTIKRHGLRFALLFVALLLPFWGFGELADEVRENEAFPFDQPLLEWMHASHSPAMDRLFLFFSEVGYQWGVVPIDIALIVALALWRKPREGMFAGIALIGSALLNLGAKQYYGRARPSLWESISPETTFSFPSGHAMGSMTLAAVLVLLTWPTRWRWPVLALMLVFVSMVGASRVYLGVHFPSDILAGWAAALVWVLGVYQVMFRGARRPWLIANNSPVT